VSVFTRQHGEYEISDDPIRLDLDTIERLLHDTYWAWERPRATIEKSIAHSICLGAYWRGAQVGFGRIVTDFATFAWICDVVIDDAHRGAGLGKSLVEAVVLHPKVADLRQASPHATPTRSTRNLATSALATSSSRAISACAPRNKS
jgi:GNAT superfamily N-acetyltransferase